MEKNPRTNSSDTFQDPILNRIKFECFPELKLNRYLLIGLGLFGLGLLISSLYGHSFLVLLNIPIVFAGIFFVFAGIFLLIRGGNKLSAPILEKDLRMGETILKTSKVERPVKTYYKTPYSDWTELDKFSSRFSSSKNAALEFLSGTIEYEAILTNRRLIFRSLNLSNSLSLIDLEKKGRIIDLGNVIERTPQMTTQVVQKANSINVIFRETLKGNVIYSVVFFIYPEELAKEFKDALDSVIKQNVS